MRAMVLGIVGVIAGIGAALAQEQAAAPTPARPTIVWDASPDGNVFARNYPQAALQRSLQGVASLCCTPREDRTLSCSVAYEWPEDEGFGLASLSASRAFVMSRASYDALRASGDVSVRRTLVWSLPGTASRGSDEGLVEARERARVQSLACPTVPPTEASAR